MANYNLIQMSIAGRLYDIRDQRMSMKLDTLNTTLSMAMDHKQETATAVVTDEASPNYIQNLTSGYSIRVLREEMDYLDGADDTGILHSLWFSQGNVVHSNNFEDTSKEQRRAWTEKFGVELRPDKSPIIRGINNAEVDISGNAKHTDYVNSPLGINYLNIANTEETNLMNFIKAVPQTVSSNPIIWKYYGDRSLNTQMANKEPDNNNIIGGNSTLSNLAFKHYFQQEQDNNYYRVLSAYFIANKAITKGNRQNNAYKIVTLDENGVIPDIFLGEMKLEKSLAIGTTQMNVTNNTFIISGDEAASETTPFVFAIEPRVGEKTTELTQKSVSTQHIKAIDAVLSDNVVVGTGDYKINGKSATNTSIGSQTIRATNVVATDCLTIPVFTSEAAATKAAAAAPSGTAAIWIAQY